MSDREVDLLVAFRTLGCKVNRVESEDIAADLIGRGVRVVPEAEARVVVVNTCTVTAEADVKARKAIRNALRLPSRPVVVVTGCLASLETETVRALGQRVVVEPDKERVADRVAAALNIGTRSSSRDTVRAGGGFRTRALLKVEDGCDAFCAYCIVPYARGVPRSVPLADAVAEAERLVAAGVREIVLTGINLGRYQDRDRDLTDLLTAISNTGVGRIRLSSIEPLDVNERLLDTLSSLPAACPHLHVPLQSGSDAVLAAMRRGYTVARYEQIIADARSALPRVAVTTDVIAGFPGESDGQAAETVDACERIGFAKLHVFRYSRREGTDAASMDQVPAALRGERAARLRELGNRLRQGFMERRLGSVAEVLIERFPEPGIAEGTTPDYLRVRLPLAEGFPVGSLVGARLVSLDGDVIHGVCE